METENRKLGKKNIFCNNEEVCQSVKRTTPSCKDNSNSNNNFDSLAEVNNPQKYNELLAISKDIENDTKNWTHYYKRHLIYFEQNQFKFALEDLNNVLLIHPTNSLARARKALTQLKLNNLNEVESILLEQINIYEDNDKNSECKLKREKYDYSFREADDLECILCMKIFYIPITLPCGHTFCKHCVECLLDHDDKCPFCRQIFYLNPNDFPVNIILKNIIEKNFPVLLDERKKEIEEMVLQTTSNLPLFTINIACFPGEELPMHIFEPRYRLMMNRVLQCSRTFGLIGVVEDLNSPLGYKPSGIGCLLKIAQCEILPDGRSLISTKGVRRFKLEDSWLQDGYFCGKIEYYDDEPVSEGQLQESKVLINYTRERLLGLIEKYKGCLRMASCETFKLLMQQIQSMPPLPVTAEQCTNFSFWLSKILPSTYETKQSLLESSSLLERMEKITQVLQMYENPSRCSIL